MGSEKAHLEKIYTAIEYWARAHQTQIVEMYAADGNAGTVPNISILWGRRYARIVREVAGQRYAEAFIDMRSGTVLKANGWKGPAKGSRGNVLDLHAGLGSTTAHGVGYLR